MTHPPERLAPRDVIDSQRLGDDLLALGERLQRGWTDATDARRELAVPPRWRPDGLVLAAIGHEAVAAELASTIAAARCPVVLARDDLPAFVGTSTLVVALESDRCAPELAALLRAATTRGALTLSVGGARDGSDARTTISPGLRGARRDLGAYLGAVLAVMALAGVATIAERDLLAAADSLAALRRALMSPEGGPARPLARRIGRTFPVVVGSAGLAAAAARRWVAQINATAKLQAYADCEPDRSLVGVDGFGQAGDVTRQLLTLVELRRAAEPGVNELRFSLTRRHLDEAIAGNLEVRATHDEPLAALLELVLIGDFVAYHLATNEGLDPGPEPVSASIATEVAAS